MRSMEINTMPKIDEERLAEIAADVRSTMKEAILDGIRDALYVIEAAT